MKRPLRDFLEYSQFVGCGGGEGEVEFNDAGGEIQLRCSEEQRTKRDVLETSSEESDADVETIVTSLRLIANGTNAF